MRLPCLSSTPRAKPTDKIFDLPIISVFYPLLGVWGVVY